MENNKKNKLPWVYHDKQHDFLEYINTEEMVVHKWINNHLSLMYHQGDDDEEKIVGFKISGLNYLIKRAEEQSKIKLTPKQDKEMIEFMDSLFERSEKK